MRSTSTPDLTNDPNKIDMPTMFGDSQTSHQYQSINYNESSHTNDDAAKSDANASILQDVNISGSFHITQRAHEIMYRFQDQDESKGSPDNMPPNSGPKMKTKIPTGINAGGGAFLYIIIFVPLGAYMQGGA